MHMGRVEIVANGTLEEGGVLGNDGEPAAQIEQTKHRRIARVDADVARGRLDYPEQRQTCRLQRHAIIIPPRVRTSSVTPFLLSLVVASWNLVRLPSAG